MDVELSASDSFYTGVGERLRLFRKRAKMDQETLAEHLRLSRTSVINIEKGRQRISLEQTWLASIALKVEISELLPTTSPLTIDQWAEKIANEEVGAKEKKNVMQWISKAKTRKN